MKVIASSSMRQAREQRAAGMNVRAMTSASYGVTKRTFLSSG